MKDILERLSGPGIADYELDPGVCEAAIAEIRRLLQRAEESEKVLAMLPNAIRKSTWRTQELRESAANLVILASMELIDDVKDKK